MGLGSPWCPLGQHLSTQLQIWITWGTNLKQINLLMMTVKRGKNGTLATTFNKLMGEANPYVRFGYNPLTIC